METFGLVLLLIFGIVIGILKERGAQRYVDRNDGYYFNHR